MKKLFLYLGVGLWVFTIAAWAQEEPTSDQLTPGEVEIRKNLSEAEYDLTTLRLWEERGPDDTKPYGDEKVVEGTRSNMIQIVTLPSITVGRPKTVEGPCPLVIVCPGGGYGGLSLSQGGTDVIDWLAERGMAGAFLKYRVPKRHMGFPMHHHPLQDIQRAVSLLRQNAEELRIDAEKIGAIGFSAGGNLCAMLATNHLPEDRLYEEIDDADKISCRPDFIAVVAPAYLTDPILSGNLSEFLQADKVRRNITPPVFIASAVTDKFTVGALHFALLLRERRVPVELHIYESGGHAEGIHDRRDNQWFIMFEDWLERQGVIGEQE